MDAAQIISGLYVDKGIDGCIRVIARKGDEEDLKQELFFALSNKPPELICDLYSRNVLFGYTYVALRNIAGKRYKKKAITYCELTEDIEAVDSTEGLSESEELFLKEFDNMNISADNGFPFHKSLIQLIQKYGSQRRVAAETGIPFQTISDSVRTVRCYLKSKL